ncbi:MAG: polysaccharide deacetylase family protein [Pseudomonadota bacterium]
MKLFKHARAIIKIGFLFAYVYLFAPVRNGWRKLTGTCHTTVLLYHRVSDESLDSITVKKTQFHRQLTLLRRHYAVLTMEEFLNSRGRPRRRPSVIVTFDDGYQDNYHAAMLMREANIPGTFFICTGIVGTSGCFPKDTRMGRRLPTLSWEQIQEMADWGFDIANHSVTHIEMGSASPEVCLAEIQKASQDLSEKLGEKNRQEWFAYPFGRSHNITKEVLNQLDTVGVKYCFSAYGGVNRTHFDPHNILRQGVDHTFSSLAFLAIVEGYRVRSY